MKISIKKLEIKKALADRKLLLVLSLVLILTLAIVLMVVLRQESTDEPEVNENDVTDIFSHENSGPVLEQGGNFVGAAQAYLADAEEIEDNDIKPELYEKAGDAYLKAGNHDEAIDTYQKAAGLYRDVNMETNALRVDGKIDSVAVDKELTSEIENEDLE